MKKIIIIIVAILLLLCVSSLFLGFNYKALFENTGDILQNIIGGNKGNENVLIEENEGLQVFINGEFPSYVDASEKSVLKYIKKNIKLFKFESDKNEFQLSSIENDELGFTKMTFKQYYDGVEVYGRELCFYFNEQKQLSTITGTVENRIKGIIKLDDKQIDVDRAIDIAKKYKEVTEVNEEIKVENYIYVKGCEAYNVYKINLAYDKPSTENVLIFVDSYSGQVIDETSLIRYFK